MSTLTATDNGRWAADGKYVEWGDWAECLLDDLDRECLREKHAPYRPNESRALSMKKAMQRGISAATLAQQMRHVRGYSERSLKTDQSALSEANRRRDRQNGASDTCTYDYQQVIKKMRHE